jgi:hypothetical protein
MKKLFSALLALISLVLLFTACTQQPEVPSTVNSSAADISQSIGGSPAEPESEQVAQATPTTNPETTAGNMPEYVPGSIKLEPDELIGGDFSYTPTKRQVYYSVTSEIIEMIPAGTTDELFEKNKDIYTEPTEMRLVTVIKYCNIPKADFVAAMEREKAKRLAVGLDITEEEFEIPNPDIIYTFDNEIINYYYRRA